MEVKSESDTKMGPPFWHKGISRKWKTDERTECTLTKCKCGSVALLPFKDYYKAAIELETRDDGSFKIIEKIYHVHEYMCPNCGVVSAKPEFMVDLISLGKNLIAIITQLHKDNQTENGIRNTLITMYKLPISRNLIRKATKLSPHYLKPVVDEIRNEIDKGVNANIDETKTMVGKTWYWMWVGIIDKRWVLFHIANTRGRIVLEKIFNFKHLKVTSDAYVVYRFFPIRQLCWAHVKTKIENAIAKAENSVAKVLSKTT